MPNSARFHVLVATQTYTYPESQHIMPAVPVAPALAGVCAVLSLIASELMSRSSVGSVVPMPTFPSTINPFSGASLNPEYVAPIATAPSTSSLLTGDVVPMPT